MNNSENSENIISEEIPEKTLEKIPEKNKYIPLNEVKKPEEKIPEKMPEKKPEKKNNANKIIMAGGLIGAGAIIFYLFYRMQKALNEKKMEINSSDETIEELNPSAEEKIIE